MVAERSLSTSTFKAPSVYIAGLRVYAFDSIASLLDDVADRAVALIAVNAEKLASPPAELRELVNTNLGYPDGVGTVLAMRRKGLRARRLAGSDLWLDLARQFAGFRRFYLLGGTDEVVRETARRLRREFPQIEIVGLRNGYMRASDEAELIDELRASRPEVVFVAMGSPRQERIIQRLLPVHPALYMGLGGSFDVYVGRVRRAPRLLQRLDMEWLFRLAQAPRDRLPRQKARLRFAVRLITGKL